MLSHAKLVHLIDAKRVFYCIYY